MIRRSKQYWRLIYVNLKHDKIFLLEHGTFSFIFELLLDIFPHSVFEFDVFFSFIKNYYWKNNWTFGNFQLTVLKTCHIARREIQIVDSRLRQKPNERVVLFINGVSRSCLDLKLRIVLILRSRQIMKRDLYHWNLRKILKKWCFINFFGQFTLRDHAKFLRVYFNVKTNNVLTFLKGKKQNPPWRSKLS